MSNDDAIMAGTPAIGGGLVDLEPMSPEDMQKTMQFLLTQQAQFSVNLDRLQERMDGFHGTLDRFQTNLDRFQTNLDRFQGNLDRFQGNLERLDENVNQLEIKTNKVTDAVIGLTALLGQTITTVDRLAVTVQELFERHLRDDHGRRPS
jgi:archaellum component FlaC